MRSFMPLVELRTVSPVFSVAGVDADERELADERVGHDLEDEGGRTARRPWARASPARPSAGSLAIVGGMSRGEGR